MQEEKIHFSLTKSEALSVLMFLSCQSDAINQTPEYLFVKDIKARFQDVVGKSVTEQDFDEWRKTIEIYASIYN